MIPTKEQLDEIILSLCDPKGKEFGANMQQQVLPMLRVAKTSDVTKSLCEALAPIMVASITLGGMNLAPTLAVLSIGFQMGQRFSARYGVEHGVDPFLDFMKSMDPDKKELP